ncbi:MAG TPA: hypothetical protein VLE93_02415 [Candidatus Saccharimonadales bacterium]|nr:hypothetical protein [Candidatus Saccharimonadales bacterium]
MENLKYRDTFDDEQIAMPEAVPARLLAGLKRTTKRANGLAIGRSNPTVLQLGNWHFSQSPCFDEYGDSPIDKDTQWSWFNIEKQLKSDFTGPFTNRTIVITDEVATYRELNWAVTALSSQQEITEFTCLSLKINSNLRLCRLAYRIAVGAPDRSVTRVKTDFGSLRLENSEAMASEDKFSLSVTDYAELAGQKVTNVSLSEPIAIAGFPEIADHLASVLGAESLAAIIAKGERSILLRDRQSQQSVFSYSAARALARLTFHAQLLRRCFPALGIISETVLSRKAKNYPDDYLVYCLD